MLPTPQKTNPKRRRRMMPIAVTGAVILLLILAVMLALSNETGTRFRNIKTGRSEERRVGKEWRRLCKSGWSPYD